MRKLSTITLALAGLLLQGGEQPIPRQHIEKGDLSVYASSDGRIVGVRVGFQKPFLGIPKCEVYAERSRITDRDTKSIWILADLGEKIEWECSGAQ